MNLQTAAHPSISLLKSHAGDLVSRMVLALFYSYFLVSGCTAFIEQRSLHVLLLLIAETLTFILILTARFSKVVDRSLYAFIITLAASFYFLVVDLSPGTRVLPFVLTASLQLGGITFQLVSKLFLGQSFGLLPAHRGIVTAGPYRLVRHPIYFGYFLNHVGFLCSAFSLHNLGVYVLLNTLQLLRMREEERVLSCDPAYRDYMGHVRSRFIPGVL